MPSQFFRSSLAAFAAISLIAAQGPLLAMANDGHSGSQPQNGNSGQSTPNAPAGKPTNAQGDPNNSAPASGQISGSPHASGGDNSASSTATPRLSDASQLSNSSTGGGGASDRNHPGSPPEAPSVASGSRPTEVPGDNHSAHGTGSPNVPGSNSGHHTGEASSQDVGPADTGLTRTLHNVATTPPDVPVSTSEGSKPAVPSIVDRSKTAGFDPKVFSGFNEVSLDVTPGGVGQPDNPSVTSADAAAVASIAERASVHAGYDPAVFSGFSQTVVEDLRSSFPIGATASGQAGSSVPPEVVALTQTLETFGGFDPKYFGVPLPTSLLYPSSGGSDLPGGRGQ